jgi:hypothetical protein
MLNARRMMSVVCTGLAVLFRCKDSGPFAGAVVLANGPAGQLQEPLIQMLRGSVKEPFRNLGYMPIAP